jgi:hypothetical protein
VAQLSTVAVAATIIDAAAAVAAATRFAARAAGSARQFTPKVNSPSLQWEEFPVGVAWHSKSSKQFHSQMVPPKQPARSIDSGEDNIHRSHCWQSIRNQQSAVDSSSGITVQDLEEGIAGLARSCPSSPLIPFRGSGRTRKSMHLGSSAGGNGHASLVLVTGGTRSPSTANGLRQSAQGASNTSVQGGERDWRGAGGAGAEVWQGGGTIILGAGGGGGSEDDRDSSGRSISSSGERELRPVM